MLASINQSSGCVVASSSVADLLTPGPRGARRRTLGSGVRALYGFLSIRVVGPVTHGFCRGVRWLPNADSWTAPGHRRGWRVPCERRAGRDGATARKGRGRRAFLASPEGRRGNRGDRARGLRDKPVGRGRAARRSCSAMVRRAGVGEFCPRSGATSTLYRLEHGPLPSGGCGASGAFYLSRFGCPLLDMAASLAG